MISTPAYTAEQMRISEAPLLANGEPLMARAAAGLARIVREVGGFTNTDAAADTHGDPTIHARHLLVLAGSGNNGGDALFAAAHLAEEIDVDILVLGSRVNEQGLAAAFAAGARRVEIPAVRDAGAPYDLVLDGILGIGATKDPTLHGNAREAVRALLPAVRDGRSRVIAVDLPSGLHPDTGEAGEVVLPASVTVTFGAVKAGLIRGRGPELAGEIILVDIDLLDELDGFEPSGTAEVSRIVRVPR